MKTTIAKLFVCIFIAAPIATLGIPYVLEEQNRFTGSEYSSTILFDSYSAELEKIEITREGANAQMVFHLKKSDGCRPTRPNQATVTLSTNLNFQPGYVRQEYTPTPIENGTKFTFEITCDFRQQEFIVSGRIFNTTQGLVSGNLILNAGRYEKRGRVSILVSGMGDLESNRISADFQDKLIVFDENGGTLEPLKSGENFVLRLRGFDRFLAIKESERQFNFGVYFGLGGSILAASVFAFIFELINLIQIWGQRRQKTQ